MSDYNDCNFDDLYWAPPEPRYPDTEEGCALACDDDAPKTYLDLSPVELEQRGIDLPMLMRAIRALPPGDEIDLYAPEEIREIAERGHPQYRGAK